MKTITSLLIAISLASTAIAGPPSSGPLSPKGGAIVTPAPESTISYSNFRVSWLHAELDEPGFDDADGVGAALEYAIHPNLYLAASGAWISESTDFGDVDISGASIGIGAHFPLCRWADVVVEVGGNYEDVDDFDDDFGVYVAPHVRALIGPVEAHLGAFYSSVFDGDWVGFVAAYVPVYGPLDLALGAELGDDYWGFSVGGRIRF